MSREPLISLNISALCGILSPIVGFVFISAAIYGSPWFSWTENWLSELAGSEGETPVYSAHGVSSILFNIGVFLTGVLGCVFWLSLKERFSSAAPGSELGLKLLFISLLALVFVGVFPLTTGLPHTAAALVFFFLTPVSLILLGRELGESDEKSLAKIGRLTFFLGIVSFLAFVFLAVPQPVGGNAVVEMVPVVSLAVFSLIFGIRFLRR